MKREWFCFAVLSLVFFLPSLPPQAQDSSSQSTNKSAISAVSGAVAGLPPDPSWVQPWERYAQRGARVLKRTSSPSSAPYMVAASFAPAVDYNSGAYASSSIAVADVNGDSKPDLLVGSACATNASPCPGDGVISVLLGKGDGTFQTPVTYDSGGYGYGAPAIAVGDVNGDGTPDLLLANYCASSTVCTNGTVTVLLGNGDGTFQTAVAYNSGGQGADSIAVADLNGDGRPDVIVANYCAVNCNYPITDGSVGVLLGNGDGTFQTAVTYDSGGQNTESIAVADLRGIGKRDLAVVSCPYCGEGSGVVNILLGNGDGTFQPAVPYFIGGAGFNSVAIVDLNGDGKLDLVVSDQCNTHCSTNGTASVLLGNGDGTFQSAVTYDSGYQTEAVAVADVNGDGKPDLVVTTECTTLGGNCPSSLVGVLLGNGDGTFRTAAFYGTGEGSLGSLAVQDVNGDGKPDALVATCALSGCASGEGIAAVLINTTVKGPAATLSGSGLNFTNQTAGVTSASQAVTLTSTGTVNLTLNSISFTGTNAGDFGQTNNCSSSLAPGASCQINVTFTPAGGPSRGATLQVTDSASGSPQTVALTGSVQDFSLAPTSQANLTVSAGQVANYAIAISPVNGFAANVALSCSGAPQLSTCTVSPGSVAVNSAGASANIVVTTTGVSAGLAHPASFPPSSGNALALWLAISGAFGLVFLGSRVRRSSCARRRPLFYGLTVLCLLSVGITVSACGGSSSSSKSSGTPDGTYNLTITGILTSGSSTLTSSTKLTLVVQ